MGWSRRALAAGVVACVTVLATATAGAVRTGTSSAVDKNGVLKYALDIPTAFGDNFDPGSEVNDCSYAVTSLIFDNLVTDGSNAKIFPGAASSYEVDPTASIITFHLRPGLTFSDGTPVTADAVKQSLFHIKKSPLRTSLLVVDTIDTPDPNTVVLHLNKPIAGD